jgi:hypothetical protein
MVDAWTMTKRSATPCKQVAAWGKTSDAFDRALWTSSCFFLIPRHPPFDHSDLSYGNMGNIEAAIDALKTVPMPAVIVRRSVHFRIPPTHTTQLLGRPPRAVPSPSQANTRMCLRSLRLWTGSSFCVCVRHAHARRHGREVGRRISCRTNSGHRPIPCTHGE